MGDGPIIHHAGALDQDSQPTHEPRIGGQLGGHPTDVYSIYSDKAPKTDSTNVVESFQQPLPDRRALRISRDLTERILAAGENRFKALMDISEADLTEGEPWLRHPIIFKNQRGRRRGQSPLES